MSYSLLRIAELMALVLALAGLMNVLRNLAFLRWVQLSGRPIAQPPFVSVLIPARNELNNIEACIRSLLDQDYPDYEVIVLDDDSSDGTGDVLDRLAAQYRRLRVIHAHDALPTGWNGKSRACQRLADAARGEWFLFADADTVHGRSSIRAGVERAVALNVAMLSGAPRQVVLTWGERLFVPTAYVLVYNGVSLKRIYTSGEWRGTAAATIGQYILIKGDVYRACGGHQAIVTRILDDMSLGGLLKRHGHRVAMADAQDIATCRMYRSFGETWHGFSKNALAILGGSLTNAAVFIVLTLFALVFPLVALTAAMTAADWQSLLLPGITVGLTAVNSVLVCRRIGQAWWVGLLYPVSMWIGFGILINSVRWRYGMGGAVWKGRVLTEHGEMI